MQPPDAVTVTVANSPSISTIIKIYLVTVQICLIMETSVFFLGGGIWLFMIGQNDLFSHNGFDAQSTDS